MSNHAMTTTERPPLSFAQRRMWLLHRIDPDNADYLISVPLALRGRLDRAALGRALDEVVARHQVLRTRYEMANGEPRQVLDRPDRVMRFHDLGDLPGDRRRARADELLDSASRRPFDLARERPFRAELVRLSDAEHLLALVLHHIAGDAWSVGVLAGELRDLYGAFTGSGPSPLDPLPMQYAEFAAWQREHVHEELMAGQAAYWRSRLTDLAPLELPTDRPRPAVRDSRGGVVEFTVPARTAAELARLGRAVRATPFMALLAAFQILLARYSGRADIAVGTPIAGRGRTEAERLIGFFVNTLVIRTSLAGDPSYLEALARVREAAMGAYAHQDLPFEKLVDELRPERDLSRNPLFQVAFVLRNVPRVPFELPGVTVERLAPALGNAKFDLTLRLEKRADGGLAGEIEYASVLFDMSTAERMAGHYLRLLDSAIAEPDAPASRLEILTGAERGRALAPARTPAATTAWPAAGPPLHGRFERQAAATPDAVAVTCGAERTTYAELNRRANRLARRLREQGVGPEVRVGLYLSRGPRVIEAMLAVLKAGGAYVPLDPDHPAERLAFILEDAGARLLITERDLLAGLPPGLLRQGETPPLVLDDDPEAARIAAHPGDIPPPAATAGNLAYVIYTSGSTGRPKGVMVTHHNATRLFTASAGLFSFGPEDVWTFFHSAAFDFSVWEIWGALLHGGRVVVVPFGVSRAPADLLDMLAAERVTVLCQTPSAFRGLVAAAERADVRPDRFALRYLVFGGEALDLAELGPWMRRFGDARPMPVNMYGITETTVHVTHRALTAGDLDEGPRSPIGRPLPDLSAYILDADMNPVPPGLPGEIFVGGAGLGRGYLNRPGLTAERFVPDPYAADPGARLYRTGDRARLTPGGELEYLDRLDHQVKIRGFRIELGEIEATLGAHPAVAAAVITVHEPEPGDRRLIAHVIPAGPGKVGRPGGPGAAELREHLTRRLPGYMVPASFILRSAFPRTANGKVDRKALAAEPPAEPDPAREYRAPRTRAQQRIAELWSAVLGPRRIGVDEGFFDLGGDSIRAVRLVGLMRDRGFDVAVQDLFRHPTIAGLAEVTGTGNGRAGSPRTEPFNLLDPADRAAMPPGVQDAYPLSMVQTGMIYEMEADPGLRPYHNAFCYRVKTGGEFSPAALREAVQILIDRHEVLRTSCHLLDYGEPVQLVHRSAAADVRIHDLRGAARPPAVERLLAAESARRFTLTRPPLFRVTAHVLDDGWLLTILDCHAVLDGWSHNSLLAELLGLYGDLRAGHGAAPYRPPGVRYADFIALERVALGSADSRRFWDGRINGHPRLRLPEGWGSPAGGEEFADRCVPIADLDAGLRRLAADAGVPLKSVLLAAHLTAMARATGQVRFFTGLLCEGRPEALGSDQVAGMFLNSVPFVAPPNVVSGAPRVLVRDVFEEELALRAHRRFPYPAMQHAWGGRTRLLDSLFTYLDFHVVDREVVDLADTVKHNPIEFDLQVTCEPGRLLLTCRRSRIAAREGDRLARIHRRVLEEMATGGRPVKE